MADTVGRFRFLTMVPRPGAPAAISDDSVPDRDANEEFRSVGDREEPNRRPVAKAAPVPDLDARLLHHVWRIAQSAARHSDGVMQWTYEYSLPQVLVLRAIVAAEGAGRPALSPSDVAHALQCSRANASELVAALVRNRSLTKRRDPANRRIVRLYPTPDGRIAEYRARALLADGAGQVFETLEGAEKQVLVTLLEKVTFT
jgi:DNA-binding MarR family transcriptional regulator